jgi:hypothetical protein
MEGQCSETVMSPSVAEDADDFRFRACADLSAAPIEIALSAWFPFCVERHRNR